MARSKTRQKSAARPARRRTQARASGAPRRREAVLPVFAHDIRTALTGILALGELLASSNIGERERRWAAGIKDSAEHLASLTTLVIDAAKADAGSLTLQQELFRPRRLIEALGETLTARAETKGLRAEVKVASDLPDVLVGDAVRLRAALENLIDNAVKFTAQGMVRLARPIEPRRTRTRENHICRRRQRHRAHAGRDQAPVPSVCAGQCRDRAPLWRRRTRPRCREDAGQNDGRRPESHQHAGQRLDVSASPRHCRSHPAPQQKVRRYRQARRPAPPQNPLRRGQSLRPRHPQHYPHRARPSAPILPAPARKPSPQWRAATICAHGCDAARYRRP